jgi:hypothetical protein
MRRSNLLYVVEERLLYVGGASESTSGRKQLKQTMRSSLYPTFLSLISLSLSV